MSNPGDWEELTERHLRSELSESEKEELAELLDSDVAARSRFVEHAQWDTVLSELLRENHDSRSVVDSEADAGMTSAGRSLRSVEASAMLTVAALIIFALTALLLFQPGESEPRIAKITGLTGSLIWTGDGGRVVRELSVGTELPGGSIEGMSPDSWFALRFNDGSTIAISGNSMLTFSDHGQKELHLKEGNLSADVVAQPPGKPMLIHTRSAVLEVVGTTFEVEAGPLSTTLNVSDGKVRMKRLHDGNTVDVPAKYRVIAAVDRDMKPTRTPDSVNHWKSQLHLGPARTRGQWSPPTVDETSSLQALPYVISTLRGRTLTIFTASFGVSSGDGPPVILDSDSGMRVRGHVATARNIYFGVTVRQSNGEFAGNFQTVMPAGEFEDGQGFELLLDLQDFRLDPSLLKIKHKLPAEPFGLVVESLWCHTLNEQAGLEIFEAELLPPDRAHDTRH